jgi:glucose-1-phosphate thymidylyltransferase
MLGVVPAAGKGTRLRPLTETKPKGMADVAGRPLLTHVFETLLDSGVDELIVVVGYRAGKIVDHFGDTFEDAPITYVHQREQRGLGHAILQTAPHIDEPFVVLNGDNIVAGTLEKQIEAHQTTHAAAVLGVERVDHDTACETGVVTVEDDHVTDIVEKPDDPPSQLATTGCYVLPDSIFDALSLLYPSERGEYELTDAIGVLVRAGAFVMAVELDTKRVNVNTEEDLKRAAEIVQ